MVSRAVKRWDDYVKTYRSSQLIDSKDLGSEKAVESKEEEEGEAEGDWDWERWKRHFAEMEEQERIVAVLKMQLREAVAREDYADAVKLKLAISGAEKNDAVGIALSDLHRAVEEERYKDAAFLRDHGGVGLVGWWAGISENSSDPYGRIIHISAEHGKYVAKSYSSRQLISAGQGFPLFEIYFTIKDGEYKKQAVYLKRWSRSSGSPKKSMQKSEASNLSQSDSSTDEQDIYTDVIKTTEEKDDDSDVADGLAGIQNVLRDMIPGVKVKVLKVVSPGKVDRDLIAKVVEQIMEDGDESSDEELEGTEIEEVKADSDIEIEEVETDAEDVASDDTENEHEISVKFVIGTLMQEMSSDLPPKDVVRVPANLEKRDRLSFSFSIEQDDKETNMKGKVLQKRAAALSAQQSYNVMSDLAKVFRSKEKVPMRVLKDVGELISLTMNQNQNHQFLSGSTIFNRIEIPSTSDPLNGLYVGAHGMYTSEILHLKRKFGQWKEDEANTKHMDLEFYEYVEACKLTGSASVPAGQVAFRAKIGKQYQLPHKGIIPEEFGVIARYKGQGRIADPGFRNPRWVDGELVILDGKYIRGGPVIGFVYWAPEYHFLIFFNRLRLPE
ncbi:uncharacterized protein A4U43_C10F8410 [Asparagus officinalis]|uniref:Uncharacterized protein n=1 Tax=Asparagus officinalis TaxID=4686 RepID=A0A5P1E1R0_ASPOF|nr:protein EXECUTER 1, chloroplastic [Asparagus officinalis]XP_020247206.1 protein EXECUTER 1, chloroplastic [Asparagus officinalis]XP_020247207.1 protein EXECUTER 1, chloroplastic [Asparagus officinalis]ONK56418.1 uncharacterized protein A4U43_C10F8410 [Asparagus officinalis]